MGAAWREWTHSCLLCRMRQRAYMLWAARRQCILDFRMM
jgi:hypothetical protein